LGAILVIPLLLKLQLLAEVIQLNGAWVILVLLSSNGVCAKVLHKRITPNNPANKITVLTTAKEPNIPKRYFL
jgi:hypothetical protein